MRGLLGGACILCLMMGGGRGSPAPVEDDLFNDFDLLCNAGLQFDKQLKKCRKQCTEDQIYSDPIKTCVSKCDVSESYNTETKECDTKCGDGLEFIENTGECIPSLREKRCVEKEKILEELSAGDVDIRTVEDQCLTRTCKDYEAEGFFCVDSWLCRNVTIVTSGANLIDIRAGAGLIDIRAGLHEQDENQCCIERRGIIDYANAKCPDLKVCCKKPDPSLQTCGVNTNCEKGKPREEEFAKCGRIISKIGLRVIDSRAHNGVLDEIYAQPGEFPHMCLIYRKIEGNNKYLGGASIIGRNKVLTVATKFLVKKGDRSIDFVNDKNIWVRCGEYDVKSTDESRFLEYQESRVRRVHIHPNYDQKQLDNNFAILETEFNFVYQNHISPVCLPQPGQQFEGLRDCVSTGWGSDGHTDNPLREYSNILRKVRQYSDILRKVSLPVVDRTQCNATINRLERVKDRFRLKPSEICVGGETKDDTCEGDGGSPHVCNINNKWVQVGAVAYGFGCGGGIPAIYSAVSSAMCWVDWVMSCIPLARLNFGFSLNFDGVHDELASWPTQSMNHLTAEYCGQWLANHPGLKTQCEVAYTDV